MSAVKVDDVIPELVLPPVSRATLALYAGASGDHNPIHIDSDFAKKAGMPDVFVHGMLTMAYLGRMLTNWQPQSQLRKFTSRFLAITEIGAVLSCSGKVTELLDDNGSLCARVEIQATKQGGTAAVIGEAIVSV